MKREPKIQHRRSIHTERIPENPYEEDEAQNNSHEYTNGYRGDSPSIDKMKCLQQETQDDEDILTDDNETPKELPKNANSSNMNINDCCLDKNGQIVIMLLVCTFAIILMAAYNISGTPIKNNCFFSYSNLLDKYPSQEKNLWKTLNVSIKEVQQFKKPSVLLFTYQYLDENFVRNFIDDVAMYSSCRIKSESVIPVTVPLNDLTSLEARSDYGYIIDKYSKELKKRGVMVVHAIQNIPGFVAQAFHSFCDEETPVIPESLFIFSLQVEGYGKSDYQLAEDTLRTYWYELKQDIFDPLFTRVSGEILKIKPDY